MWSRKLFRRAIDRHVQGINDLFAPWNQPDLPKMCQECERLDDCEEICYKLFKQIKKESLCRRQLEDQQYMRWLLHEVYEYLDEENLYNRIALINLIDRGVKIFYDLHKIL